MKKSLLLLGLTAIITGMTGCGTFSKTSKTSASDPFHVKHVVFPKNATLDEKVNMAAHLVPTQAQHEWQQNELTAFIHFGINTFTGNEWGNGKEDPKLFNPTHLDTDQWVSVLKSAGFQMVILTAKHHDGFCLWPSATTKHSVESSPWKDGKGDVVKELSESCKKYGMKFGVYLSPWDRNAPSYGQGEPYNKMYVEQLTELLTNYGTVDEVWFDGANGEGPNGKKQIYDWDTVTETIRRLQPKAVIAITGTDVRWVGNERGMGRATEWSATVLPPASLTRSDSVRSALGLRSTSADLGSRELIAKANEMFWYPSEVDVSIRPGWFYHEAQDAKVKTLSDLAKIYFHSVGMNSVLLLNIPPNKEGRLASIDVERIKAFGSYVRELHQKDAVINPSALKVSNDNTITLKMDPSIAFDVVSLSEDITKGQRIESFKVEALTTNGWTPIAEGTTIGYKRMLLLDQPISTSSIRVRILSTRGKVHMKEIHAYHRPQIVEAVTATKDQTISWDLVSHKPLTLDLKSTQKVSKIIYRPDQNAASETLPVRYELYISDDGKQWKKVSSGEFGNIINNPIPQTIKGNNLETRYLRLTLHNINGELISVPANSMMLIK